MTALTNTSSSSFNATCVAWIQTSACPEHVAQRFQIMCLFFAAVTSLVFVLTIIMTIRRLRLLDSQNVLFKIMAPQLLIWAPLQIFYTLVHGASRTNFNVPTWLIALFNLQSSMILGTTIPQVIITWSESYQQYERFQTKRYQRYYWVAVISFSIVIAVTAVLAGINVDYYHVAMRVLLGIWVFYLLTCSVMLFYFGIKNYRILANSIDASMINNRLVSDAQTQILFILCFLCGVIFIGVIGLFLYYAGALQSIESSDVAPLVIWICFKTGSVAFVVFWNIFFWRTTTALLRLQEESSSTSHRTTTHPPSPRQ